MKLRDITTVIEQVAPLSLAEEWDNPGIQIGRADSDVKQALLCVDVTDDVLQEAVDTHCDLIISHHPLFFHPLKHLRFESAAERIAYRAVREGISIYSAHTNLDNSPVGINGRLAWRLCLQEPRILSPAGAEHGSGMIGRLTRPMDATSFLRQLKHVFNVPDVRHSALIDEPIVTVAVCGGAGGFLLEEAVKQGAQAFVTADLRHHDFLDVDGRLLAVDIGHFESEQCAKEVFYDILSKKIPTFATRFAETDKSPIFHL